MKVMILDGISVSLFCVHINVGVIVKYFTGHLSEISTRGNEVISVVFPCTFTGEMLLVIMRSDSHHTTLPWLCVCCQ